MKIDRQSRQNREKERQTRDKQMEKDWHSWYTIDREWKRNKDKTKRYTFFKLENREGQKYE